MANRNVENALYTSRSLYFSGISAIIPNTFTIISPMIMGYSSNNQRLVGVHLSSPTKEMQELSIRVCSFQYQSMFGSLKVTIGQLHSTGCFDGYIDEKAEVTNNSFQLIELINVCG